MQSNYFHAHLHTQFSTLDGMSPVDNIVERIERYKQPALAITDHGNMSGVVKGYKATKAAGIQFFPGIEQYIIDPDVDITGLEEATKAQRYHLGILALDAKGYKGLVKMSTLSFQRPRFYKFPRLLIDDLIEFGEEYGEHIAVTTGCVFGLLEKTLIDYGEDSASRILTMLNQVTPNVYVEVQKHNIPDDANEYPEDLLIKQTLELAEKHSLPVLTTNDCHYLDQKQRSAHDMMKKIGYQSEEGGAEFPGDTYHVASTGWMKEKWDTQTWDRFEEAYSGLLAKNNLSIPELDTFKAHVPEMSKTPDTTLRDLCESALEKYLDNEPEEDDTWLEYHNRLDHELRVISITETPNYFLLVKQCVDYAKGQNIPIEARGSAAGSLVCFLLGITQVDPLVWGTTFERFLSEDRVGQMPDVDIDISDVDRGIILDYLANLEVNGVKYKTSQIGTFNKLGQAKNDPNDTGSVFNSYMVYLRNAFKDNAWKKEQALAKAEDRKPVKSKAEAKGAINFKMSPEFSISSMADVNRIRPKDYTGLKEIIDMNSVYKSKGTHAGGILISGEDVNIEEFIPLMMIPGQKKDTVVTQYTMKDVEQFGLLKMDWLGQTSLTVMRKCQEFIGRENPLDFTWIPFDDQNVMKYVTAKKYRGKTGKNHPGLFHLEQFPKSVAMCELQPKTTEDFVIWQAYSMPGAADSGAKDIYLRRRNSKKQEDYGYRHQILRDTFDHTNGVMLFQEQVLEVCRGIGMPPKELTNFFKIIKDSGAGATERNKKRLDEAKPRFEQLATDAGLTPEEIAWVWKQMVAMGGYAFNRAHAASYGIRSYRTAYLKYYYPVEYMAALLYCWAGSNTKAKGKGGKEMLKEHIYLEAAEDMSLPIFPAKIDKSEPNWKVDEVAGQRVLRKGFLSIKGIGTSAAEKIGAGLPYSDMLDFVERSGVTGTKPYLKHYNKTGEHPDPSTFTGNLKILWDAGVLSPLEY
jgi:DNA polymerase-3 subunit alpha